MKRFIGLGIMLAVALVFTSVGQVRATVYDFSFQSTDLTLNAHGRLTTDASNTALISGYANVTDSSLYLGVFNIGTLDLLAPGSGVGHFSNGGNLSFDNLFSYPTTPYVDSANGIVFYRPTDLKPIFSIWSDSPTVYTAALADNLPMTDPLARDWPEFRDGTLTVSAVPEPGTMMLLGAGFLGLAVYGKRRKNAKPSAFIKL